MGREEEGVTGVTGNDEEVAGVGSVRGVGRQESGMCERGVCEC
jgi:hypothetical protein